MITLALFAAALRLWTPLALAAMGGVVSERSGVVNIALEGMMLGGAFASVAAARATGNALVGLLAGVVVGAVIGFLHAIFTQALRVPHILSGVALNLGVLGLTTFALRDIIRRGADGLDTKVLLPGELMGLVAVAAVAGTWFVLYRLPLGLRLRACGENAKAARSAGLSVARLRYGAVITSGALAGLGGVALALTGLGAFTENMTAGRGYIALAAVIFGRWNPLGAAAAALLFGFGDALQLSLQTAGLTKSIPPDFLTLLPYLLTLIALASFSGKGNAPASLGVEED
jgi:general nucleoside transport system permease protein